VTTHGERLLAALEAEIEKLSKLEHELSRTRRLLQEYATHLRLGTNPHLIMTALRLSVPNETTLALIERVGCQGSRHLSDRRWPVCMPGSGMPDSGIASAAVSGRPSASAEICSTLAVIRL